MKSASFFHAFADRRFFLVNVIVVAGIFLTLFFPQPGMGERLILAFCALFLLPVLFLRTLARESLEKYGFGWGKWNALSNILAIVFGVGIFGGIAWGIFVYTPGGQALLENPKSLELQKSFVIFVGSLAMMGWFLAWKEFFFRGFFLLSWKRKFGAWSLFAHLLLVATVSIFELGVFAGSSPITTFSLVVLWSTIASLIAFETESVFVSFCFSFFSAILLSVIAISFS